MSDLNETLAQEAAELINGGEWRDGKWYSDGHRDAWRRALKPAADRIEKLEALVEQLRDDNSSIMDSFDEDFLRQDDRIEKLEAALRQIEHENTFPSKLAKELGHKCGPFATIARKVLEKKDD